MIDGLNCSTKNNLVLARQFQQLQLEGPDHARAAGKARQRAGRRRNAKRSPEAVRAALEAAMSMYSLSSFKLFWDPSLETKALLAWNADTAVLAFRGTASLTNAWSDLQVPGPL